MSQFQDSADMFITGTGRIVQGNPYEKQTIGHDGKPLPEEKQKYFVGLAFDKTQDAITKFPTIWALMQQAAQAHPAASMWASQNWNGFHFKLDDGDAPQYAGKPGFKGCWILKFSNGFPPQILDENQMDVSQNKDAVYRGCYARIIGSTKQNGASGSQAGIYLNFNCIQRVAHGERIQSGPDVRSVLGAVPIGALPPGASAIPQSPAGAPSMPAAAAPVAAPGLPTASAAAAVPGLPGVPGAGAPVAAPAPVDKQSLMNNGMDYNACIAQGWTDEMLVQHGHMRAPQPAAPVAPPAPAAPAVPGQPVGGAPIGQLPPGVPASVPGAPAIPGTHPYAQ